MDELVLRFQSLLQNWSYDTVTLIPLGYAFGAGMISSVNPCGFAMLPAFVSLYLGTGRATYSQKSVLRRVSEAMLVGGSVSLGFIVLFGVIGSGISAGGFFLIDWMPWMGLVVGIGLVGLGIALIFGLNIYTAIPERLAHQIGNSNSIGLRSYFLFGVAYAIASLSCTLPVFLIVVTGSINAGGFLYGVSQFLSYSFGMGVVLVVIALAVATFKGGIITYFKKLLPYIERMSAGLLILAGAFTIYYWVAIGDIAG